MRVPFITGFPSNILGFISILSSYIKRLLAEIYRRYQSQTNFLNFTVIISITRLQFNYPVIPRIRHIDPPLFAQADPQGTAEFAAAGPSPPKGQQESPLFCEKADAVVAGIGRVDEFVVESERAGRSELPRSEERRVGKECRSRWS